MSGLCKWYADKDLAVYFSEEPDPDIRVIKPEMSKEEKDDIAEFPFINKKEITAILFDLKRSHRYSFRIAKGFKWDGATIPWFAWVIIGAKTDPRFLIPSMIHDILCNHKNFCGNDRYFADKVFERLLYVSGVPAWKRWAMFHSVDNFQKFQGWRA
jgi:hypothetical protein